MMIMIIMIIMIIMMMLMKMIWKWDNTLMEAESLGPIGPAAEYGACITYII